MEVSLTAQGSVNEDSGRFRMKIQSMLNFANRVGLNTKKFLLMSRGFEALGLDRKASDTKDFLDSFQPDANNDNEAAYDLSALIAKLDMSYMR